MYVAVSDMKEKDIKEILKSDTTESLLYIATMEPKTQTEAIELIYNKKNINSSPIQTARNRLVDDKVIVLGDGISKVPLKAQVDVFLAHLLEKSKARKTSKPKEHTLNDTDIKYLKLILDSDYYRGIFFNRYFFSYCYGVHRGGIVRDNDKLSLRGGAFGYMELCLTSVLLHSEILERDFNDLYVTDIKKIAKDYGNSNQYVNHFLKSIKSDFNDRMLDNDILFYTIDYCALDYNPLLREIGYTRDDGFQYYLDKTAYSGLFLLFPPALVFKLNLLDLTTVGSTFKGRYIVEARDRR